MKSVGLFVMLVEPRRVVGSGLSKTPRAVSGRGCRIGSISLSGH